jgi:hypothetical protein
MIRPKAARLQLDPVSYESLRQQILRRDGWRCQSCGTMSNLEVHHKRFRSHSGRDSEGNLITLCSTCHASVHSPPLQKDQSCADRKNQEYVCVRIPQCQREGTDQGTPPDQQGHCQQDGQIQMGSEFGHGPFRLGVNSR